MGNGASSQGGLPSHDKRDVGTSVVKEQHDWQAEQAVAPKPETHSLQEMRKPYIIMKVTGMNFFGNSVHTATSRTTKGRNTYKVRQE